MPLNPDDIILNGKYRIVRLIGEGGMARVWLAEEPRFGNRWVAIKEPRTDLLPELAQEVRLRYQREVQICAALGKARTPHIVQAFTTELLGDTLLLVMEYMPGGDLAALMEKHPDGLPLEQTVRITLDLLAALEGIHAHKTEIVHRDVKPSNVLFDEQGQAHLADFGLAQLAGMSGRSQLAGGQHPGTPIYMAPEQESSPHTLTPAADLYAMGCMLFEMLTGKRYKRVRPGTLPSAMRAEVPGWLDGVVAKALAEDPWERWHDAAEMARPLREGLQREAKARREAEKREQARPGRRQRARLVPRPSWFWPAVGVAGVLLIAIAVALALLLGGGTPPTDTPTPKATQVAVVEPTATSTLAPTRTAPPPTSTSTPSDTPYPKDTVHPTASPTHTVTGTRVPSPTTTPRQTNTRTPPISTPRPRVTLETPTPALSGHIAFQSKPSGGWEKSSTYILALDTGVTTRIGYGGCPSLSPDGTKLLYVSYELSSSQTTLLVDLKTWQADELAWSDNSQWGCANPGSVSWDGHRVALNRGIIWENGATRQVGSWFGASWSPDDVWIAWSGSKQPSIGGSAIQLVSSGFNANWSITGRIAFDDDSDVYSMNADGSDVRQLTSHPARDYDPTWSPDGSRLIFVSERDGNAELYVMDANGNNVMRLTYTDDREYHPSWAP